MLARCREKVPGVAVSSDFIVGFCGETEESFEKSCELGKDLLGGLRPDERSGVLVPFRHPLADVFLEGLD